MTDLSEKVARLEEELRLTREALVNEGKYSEGCRRDICRLTSEGATVRADRDRWKAECEATVKARNALEWEREALHRELDASATELRIKVHAEPGVKVECREDGSVWCTSDTAGKTVSYTGTTREKPPAVRVYHLDRDRCCAIEDPSVKCPIVKGSDVHFRCDEPNRTCPTHFDSEGRVW